MADTALILTRPAQSAEQFLADLSPRARNAVRVIVSPLMEIVQLKDVSGGLKLDADVIFSSANGVHCAPEGQGRRAFCIGCQTTNAASLRGWRAEQVGETADQLVAALSVRPYMNSLVHLSGTHRRGSIAERLRLAGHGAETYEIYDQRLLKLTAQARAALNGPAIVPLFSPRTAIQLGSQTDSLEQVSVVAMSQAVAQSLEDRKVAVMYVLNAPTRKEMLGSVENLCLGASLA